MKDLSTGTFAHLLKVLGCSSALRYGVEVKSEPWGWDSLHSNSENGIG